MGDVEKTGTPRTNGINHTRTQDTRRSGWKWIIVGPACFTLLVMLWLLVLLALSLAKIIMGGIHMNDCPLESMVPVYLVVSGLAAFIVLAFYKLKPEKGENKQFEERLNYCSIVGLLGLLFIFIWLICGTVWTFNNYSAIDGCMNDLACCDRSLLQFSAVITIIDWFYMGITIITLVSTTILVYCARKRS